MKEFQISLETVDRKVKEKFPVRLAKSRRHWNFGRLIVQRVGEARELLSKQEPRKLEIKRKVGMRRPLRAFLQFK